MRAAAILGPGNVSKAVAEFQRVTNVQWTSLIEQADAVIIFGGDGTVHHQLPTLLDLDVPLQVVPCGSGNDFARALGLRSVRDSISAWQRFAFNGRGPQEIDLGMIRGSRGPEQLKPTHQANVSGAAEAVPSPFRDAGKPAKHGTVARYFCCVAGVGLDSQINKRAN